MVIPYLMFQSGGDEEKNEFDEKNMLSFYLKFQCFRYIDKYADKSYKEKKAVPFQRLFEGTTLHLFRYTFLRKYFFL